MLASGCFFRQSVSLKLGLVVGMKALLDQLDSYWAMESFCDSYRLP